MENQVENQIIDKIDPLDEVNVIDKQNLITCYVMLVYNVLYNLGDSIAGHLLEVDDSDPRDRIIRAFHNRGRKVSPDMPTIPHDHNSTLTFSSSGPSDWDNPLFDESMTVRLHVTCTATSASVRHTIKCETTAVNDEMEEQEHQNVEETLALRRRINNALNGNVFFNVDDEEENEDNETILSLEEVPSKRYFVWSEVYNQFSRDRNFFGVSAESALTFGFSLVSAPERESSDLKYDLTFRVSTYVRYERNRCILTSLTLIEETRGQGEVEIKKVREATPVISLSQPMDRHFALLISDGIANNYTAVIQIIGLALLLHFGTS